MLAWIRPPKTQIQNCDGCGRSERSLSRKELPSGWLGHDITLPDGRIWTASFCPQCQKDLGKAEANAKISVER
jgi:hypothetical protein